MEGAIVKEDIAKVSALAQQVLGVEKFRSMTRLGGLTNHTYKVELDNNEAYVVRIPGEGTEELIDRRNEMISTKLACDLDVDAKMLYFGPDGAKVTRYIPDAVTMSAASMHDTENIKHVAAIFRKIHTCGVDTGVPFEVFDMAQGYERIIREKCVAMFDDYADVKAAVIAVKAEIDACVNIRKVPCHNDPLCENWVRSGDRMYLIDWEYAGMNDGMWDIADVSIEAGFDAQCDTILLQEYLGRKPDTMDEKHFLASKIYVDYLWTLWAKTRVPYDGQPMEDWAVERYSRMKQFLDAYHAI